GLPLTGNALSIAADIGGRGGALQLVVGGAPHYRALGFGLIAVAFQLFVPYQRLARVLKWLTLSLVSYAFVLLMVDVPWGQVAAETLLPPISFKNDYFVLLVGVLGTTISPYLFFWQASQEVEEQRAGEGEEPLREAPDQARKHL